MLHWPQVCMCIISILIFAAFALRIIQTSERCAKAMQKYNAHLDFFGCVLKVTAFIGNQLSSFCSDKQARL